MTQAGVPHGRTLVLILWTTLVVASGYTTWRVASKYRAQRLASLSPTETAEPTASSTPVPPTYTPTLTPTPSPGPRVVGSYPINGDLAVAPSRPLIIDFDRPMDQESVAARLVFSPTIVGTIQWPSSQRLVYTPAISWTGPAYQVTLAAGSQDRQGTPMRDDYVLSFGAGGRGVPVPILMYHHLEVLDRGASRIRRDLTVSPSAFAAQMSYLVDHGWRSISPTRLAAYLRHGEPLPPKPVIISLDDGYQQVYTVAYPVSVRTGLRPVLFIVPNYVGARTYLTWEELGAMVASGFSIGAHGLNHSNLRKADAVGLRRQTEGAQLTLVKQLGVAVDAFCYPYGVYDRRTVEALQTYRFTTGFTSNKGIYQSPSDPYRLNRTWVGYDATIEEFAQLLP